MNKFEILNIEIPFNLSQNYSKEFNIIAEEIRKDFIGIIENASENYKYNIFWWISNPSSRNTFASPLFFYCCFLSLVDRLIENGEFPEQIITDNPEVYSILTKKFKELHYYNIKLKRENYIIRIRKKIFNFFNYYLYIFTLLYQKAYVGIKKRDINSLNENQDIILIDSFVSQYFTAKRYYNGLWDNLKDEEKKGIFFVPTFTGNYKFKQLFNNLMNSDENYIFKEQYVKYTDILSFILTPVYISRLKVSNIYFNGSDISDLINEDLKRSVFDKTSIIALLNYSFFKRIKEKDIDLKLSINFFENQIVGKGWNIGIRDFYPSIKSKGYQGWIASKHYLCQFPTTLEYNLKIIPKTICVSGIKMVSNVKEFCDNLNVEVAPNFYAKHIFNNKNKIKNDYFFNILVVLPYFIEGTHTILKLISSFDKEYNDKSIKYYIKPHPARSFGDIKKHFEGILPKKYDIVIEPFSNSIYFSDLIVSLESASIMEALAVGVPAIIIGSINGLTYNPVPPSINNDIYRLVYTVNDFFDSLLFFKGQKVLNYEKYEEISNEIREGYFTPVSREKVYSFLELENN